MKINERTKRPIILAICITLVMTAQLCADDCEISPEELEAFSVTLYTEKAQLPLDDLVTLDAEPYARGELQGSYVLVNLWASWCPFCRKEKASMERLYEEEDHIPLAVLTVSLGEEIDTVKEYMDENQYSFPVVVDRENKLREAYAPRVPTSYVLDPEGNIVARINGNKEWDSTEALKVLRGLISEADRM